MKEFSKFEIAALKRTAANVSREVSQKERLTKKINELTAELSKVQERIDAWQAPIKSMTGGYSTEELVERVVETSGKNSVVKFILKYPKTVIPPTENSVEPQVVEEQPVEEQSTEEQPTEENTNTFINNFPFDD